MSRVLRCLLVALTAAPFAGAQPQPGEPIPLTLSPAALPSPASAYRLLPARPDLVPGNAAAIYYRSMASFAENPGLLDSINSGQWFTWSRLPLEKLPRGEVYAKLSEQQALLRDRDQAARCRDCDWELADRPEGLGLLLPEVQKSRATIPVLIVRARYELAAGRPAEALRSLQSGYAFAYHMGRGPTLIHVLVGAAMIYFLDQELDGVLQQPGAPNLYWALTLLPQPFLDPALAIDEDRTLLERQWPAVKRLEEGPMSPQQARAFRHDVAGPFRRSGLWPPTPAERLTQLWQQEAAYPEARRALREQGVPAEEVDAMPLLQVVALDAVRRYHRAWDDYLPWTRVPDFDRQDGYRRAHDRLRAEAQRVEYRVLFPRSLSPGSEALAPAPLMRIAAVGRRTDRRFTALRCVEAIRLYAAGHQGRLPPSLKDVTEVPIPVDPTTHRPFEYEVRGDRARLTAPLWDGDRTPPYERLTYDITLRSRGDKRPACPPDPG
jgi:hypothetical protein